MSPAVGVLPGLARFQTGRNRPVDRNRARAKVLEHGLTGKVIRLFRNVL